MVAQESKKDSETHRHSQDLQKAFRSLFYLFMKERKGGERERKREREREGDIDDVTVLDDMLKSLCSRFCR